MKEMYLAYACGEKGNNIGDIGIFPTESDAKKAVIGQGFWGGDGSYYKVFVYESYDEYKTKNNN